MKNILVMNFFPAFVPPSSGGELRYYNLYLRLSKYFNITLLSPTYSHNNQEVLLHSDTFREFRVPKEPIHDEIHIQILQENIADEFSALVCALSSKHYNKYYEFYLDLQENTDLIIHESPYMLNYDLLFGFDKRPRIYNSYNVESDLVSSVWKGEAAQKYKKYIYNLEKRLVCESDTTFAVSKEDAESFKKKFDAFNKHFAVVPNGVNAEEYLPRKRNLTNSKTVLFFGSLHQPNIEAADFIINYLAPALPNIEFIIAGNCVTKEITQNIGTNVVILGKVSNDERLSLLSTADIAINPMFSGGGTNLKMLEYLAAGVPVITTPIGARGLYVINNKHAFIADKQEFADKLLEVINNMDFANEVAMEGRRYLIENFSWDSIAKKAASEIDKVFKNRISNPTSRDKILVLNDFAVSNPNSGGEVRINRIYSHLSKYYDIKLLCFSNTYEINVSKITHNFSELQIPKTREHKNKEELFSWYISANDIINFMEAPKNLFLSRILNVFIKWADLVVLTHPYMVGLLDNKESFNKPIIYESHNAEFFLKREMLKDHPYYDKLIEAAKECESKAIKKSSRIIAVSENDIEKLIALGAIRDNIDIVPNGADIEENKNKSDLSHIKEVFEGNNFIVFIGSAHYPNIEALKYISENLANKLPHSIFGIIGSVCGSITINNNNIVLFGVLDEIKKDIILELADIAINPVISGSGSNLKLAEYFSKGLPVVTTPFGARGYNIRNNQHAVICHLDRFAQEIESLLNDNLKRNYLGTQGYIYAKNYLDWTKQAELFRCILETKTLRKEAFDIKNKKQFLVDVSVISKYDEKTGIQRVIRAQLFYLNKLLPDYFKLVPVYLDNLNGNWYYKYANYYAFDIGIKEFLEPEIPVNVSAGDILYMPDWYLDDFLEAFKSNVYQNLKTNGVKIVVLVYDILPIQLPQYFPEGHNIKHAEWIKNVAKVADKIVCISKSVAHAVETFLNVDNLKITYIHLGADIKKTMPTVGLPEDNILNILRSKISFLMVGTIEPRKGYLQTIKAFDILWKQGYDINLVIIGKEGWLGAPDSARRTIPEIIKTIENHPELNNRLFWLSGISDEYLEKIYESSSCFIMASEGEGFGLPLIEAARHKLPIIARDIPVYKEVASNYAYYFTNDTDPQTLARGIEQWLNLYKGNKHPKSDGMQYLNWKENVKRLLEVILEGE